MTELQSWRELLGLAIGNSRERQRIADELKMNPVTLIRWSNGKSNPRPENLRALLAALPQYHSQLARLIAEEFPAFQLAAANADLQKDLSGIPATFYANLLTTYTTSSSLLRSATIFTQIVQQMIVQLDPQQRGIAIIVARCMAPDRDQKKVRSLRQTTLRMSRSWPGMQSYPLCFFGAESQTGHATAMGHPIIVQTREEKEWRFPLHKGPDAESFMSIPILLADRVAGGMSVCSMQANYFTAEIVHLIQDYTNLLVLAFDAREFYDLSQIELGLMPEYARQAPILSSFQQRVSRHLIQATKRQYELTRPEAEARVWCEMEEELLRLAYRAPGE